VRDDHRQDYSPVDNIEQQMQNHLLSGVIGLKPYSYAFGDFDDSL